MPGDIPRGPSFPRGGGFTLRRPRRSRIVLSVILLAIVGVVVSARSIAGFYIDLLWHTSLDRTDIFWGVILNRVGLSAAFIAAFAAVLIVNLAIADRFRPEQVPMTIEERALAGYRSLTGARRWLLRLLVAVLLGFMVGSPAATQWQEWLLYRNASTFGETDPLFNRDVSFYVMQLPFIEFVVNWGFAALVLVTLVTFAAHYLNGGIRLQAQGRRVTVAAKAHLSILFALLSLLRAVDYWFSRFDLTRSTRGVVQGATFTDVNAQLPATNLMILVSVAVALLFLASIRQRGWRLPILATLLWVVIAVAAGGIYPALIQRFQVQPNVSTKELPYIGSNIAATKAAMGLDNIVRTAMPVEPLTTELITADPGPLRDVRQLDPVQMRDRFTLDEGRTSFYAIRDLDVDRYEIDGRVQQVLVAAREINTAGIPNRTWVSRHLLYTHGCGLIAAPASTSTIDGRPLYVDLPVARPELYFGEGINDYAVIRTQQSEQACSADQPAPGELGGVALSSTVRRVAYAVNYGEYNLFGSSLIQPNSLILHDRNVVDRVRKLAPFLRFDADPYPVAVDGRVKWVVDAYTLSDRYPYSQTANVDQLTPGSGLLAFFNYVRNSVKAVVDAYDGSVTMYVIDRQDPLIASWSKAFPEMFTPVSEAPTELVEHFRYPEDLFRVQTNVYGRYQFDDATLFFNRDAAWSVAQAPPTEPEAVGGVVGSTGLGTNQAIDVQDANVLRFEPYFTMFHDPLDKQPPKFSMLRPFVPFSADNARKELRALMVVSSDPRSYGRITVYELNEPLPEGPGTVAAEFGSNPVVSQQVTLLDQRGSRVIFGDLQMIPLQRGLLYVRPLFTRPDDVTARQIFVRKFLVSYDNRVVMADSLTEAISRLFPGFDTDLGDRTDDGKVVDNVDGATPDVPADSAPSDGTTPTTVAAPPATLPVDTNTLTAPELLTRADQLFREADAALSTSPPDFATYQQKLAEAQALVRRALELVGG